MKACPSIVRNLLGNVFLLGLLRVPLELVSSEPGLCGGPAILCLLASLRGGRIPHLTPIGCPRGIPRSERRQNHPHVDEKALLSCFLKYFTPRTSVNHFSQPRSSSEHSAVVSSQGEGRRHVNLPTPTSMRHFRSDLDQTLDEPPH